MRKINIFTKKNTQLFQNGMLKASDIRKSIILVIVLIGFCFSGCAVVDSIDNLNGILDEPPLSSGEMGDLLQAEYAFFSENYTHAKDIYTKVKTESTIPLYINNAHYGLACIEIVLAANTEELKMAIASLKEWKEPGTEVLRYEENPRMLIFALNKQINLVELECEPEIRYVITKKQGELLEKSKEEIRELKNKIMKLQHQISVLEAIDQEIQEKRKPL